MKSQALIASIVSSGVIAAYLIHLGGWITRQFYTWSGTATAAVDPRSLMPVPTQIALGGSWLAVALVALITLFGIAVLLCWRGGLRAAVVTVCIQALTVWASFFGFCYSAFMEPLRLHRPSECETESFFTVYGGAFPVTLLAILLTLGFGLRHRDKPLSGHNQSSQATAARRLVFERPQ